MRKDIILITGDQGSGKSTLARLITSSMQTTVLSSKDLQSDFIPIPKSTEAIIVEDFQCCADTWELLQCWVTAKEIWINWQGKHPFKMKPPFIVVVAQGTWKSIPKYIRDGQRTRRIVCK